MPRLEVAVIGRDGTALIVNAARPGSLVAFSDAHEGKEMPETPREVAWLVHHALGEERPLEEWLATLEDLSAQNADVRLARKIIRGDPEAIDRALGRYDPDEDEDEDEAKPSEPEPETDAEAETEAEAEPDPPTLAAIPGGSG